MKLFKIMSLGIGLVFLCLSLTVSAEEPVAKEPVLLTSAGLGKDVKQAEIICKRIKLDYVLNEMAKADDLADCNTLILVAGGSSKGLGEAGVDPDQEVARINELIEKAKADGKPIITMHIGGEARRGPLSDRFIETATLPSDYLIITEGGNKDGFFSKAAEDKGISFYIVGKRIEAMAPLKKIFGKE